MIVTTEIPKAPQYGMIHPDFEDLVQRIIRSVDTLQLADLRKDFHTRLRLTLTQPDKNDLVEDLWDFFYDWCVFEYQLPEKLGALGPEHERAWHHVNGGNTRSLFYVAKAQSTGLSLKDLYTSKTYWVAKQNPSDFLGIGKADIVEGRLISAANGPATKVKSFAFVRRPSYHPVAVHNYLKAKVKAFRKADDYASFQTWLWLVVGMYLKHRIYSQMPIDKIYDDNSRI